MVALASDGYERIRQTSIYQVKIASTPIFSGQQLFFSICRSIPSISNQTKNLIFIRCRFYSSTWLAIVFLCNNLPSEINFMPFVRFHWSSCMYDPWVEKVTGVQDKHFSKTRGNKSNQLQNYSLKERPAAPGLGSEIAKEGTESNREC